jgi:solute carrier family 25 phosphate transporter 3
MNMPESDDGTTGSNSHEATAGDRTCWSLFVGTMLISVSLVVVLLFHLWDAHGTTVRVHSTEYFILCLMGGVLSGLPHTILTPLDVVKCRMQVGEYTSMMDGFRTIWRTEGSVGAFYRGWAPTFIGYSCQGALKFGLYEYFKYILAPKGGGSSHGHTTLLYLVASACAEVFADVSLSPWEAVKVKMQTTRKFEPRLNVVMPRMWDGEGLKAFFKGLPPLWARQIPYTMAKFTFFEKTIHFIYAHILNSDKANYSAMQQLSVTLLSGYISGVVCAVVSHPADTVITKINQRHDGGIGASFQILQELGCLGVWRGVLLRILMIGTLTGLQWLIYDSFKVSMGLQTTGASK